MVRKQSQRKSKKSKNNEREQRENKNKYSSTFASLIIILTKQDKTTKTQKVITPTINLFQIIIISFFSLLSQKIFCRNNSFTPLLTYFYFLGQTGKEQFFPE